MNPGLLLIGVAGLVCAAILLVGTAWGLLTVTVRRGRQLASAGAGEK